MMPLPALPALKHLGELADVRPCIVTDSREQNPLPFHRLQVVRDTLQSGDYSFRGGEELFSVERKSVADLVGCCCGDNRERFERELHRLRGFRFARLLIVGTVEEIRQRRYHSRVNPVSVLHSLSAWEARFIPVVWEPTPEAAGYRVESWAFWYAREIVENSNALLRAQKPLPPATVPPAPNHLPPLPVTPFIANNCQRERNAVTERETTCTTTRG